MVQTQLTLVLYDILSVITLALLDCMLIILAPDQKLRHFANQQSTMNNKTYRMVQTLLVLSPL